MKKMFDLENRVREAGDYFCNVESARDYDINIRVSTIIPVGRVATKVSEVCKEGDKILDIGCATGLLSLRIGGQNEKAEVIGIDNNDNLLQVAEENALLSVICNAPGMVQFQYAELDALPFPDNSFDVVCSHSALHKWDNPEKVLQEINRVCKDGGKIYLQDTARDSDEGMISFILQYISAGKKEFLRELKASYTVKEVKQILSNAGLEDWKVEADNANLSIIKE